MYNNGAVKGTYVGSSQFGARRCTPECKVSSSKSRVCNEGLVAAVVPTYLLIARQLKLSGISHGMSIFFFVQLVPSLKYLEVMLEWSGLALPV